MCDAFPTIDECESSIKEVTINKSPGIDVLSNEFYKKKDLDTLFYDALREIFDNNEMSFFFKVSNNVTYS